jgi:hypothetical protein
MQTKIRQKTNKFTSNLTQPQAGAVVEFASELLIAAHNVGGYGAELVVTPADADESPELTDASVSLGKFQVIATADKEGFIDKAHLLIDGNNVDSVDDFVEAVDAAVTSKEEVNPNFHPITAVLSALQLVSR